MAAKTKYISLRPLFLAALAAAAPAAGGAAAQETAAGSTVNVDTLTLTIAEVQRLALTRNPSRMKNGRLHWIHRFSRASKPRTAQDWKSLGNSADG